MDLNTVTPEQLWTAATAGTFHLEADTAQELAGHCDWLALELWDRMKETQRWNTLDGFGGFDSAQQLQRGFERKADQGFDALKAMQQKVRGLQAACLKAGGLLHDEDFTSARAMVSKTEELS